MRLEKRHLQQFKSEFLTVLTVKLFLAQKPKGVLYITRSSAAERGP